MLITSQLCPGKNSGSEEAQVGREEAKGEQVLSSQAIAKCELKIQLPLIVLEQVLEQILTQEPLKKEQKPCTGSRTSLSLELQQWKG